MSEPAHERNDGLKPVAMTGANGFLGWHTRAALRAKDVDVAAVAVGEAFDLGAAASVVDGAPRLIHLAGVNRAAEEAVREGNLLFANQMAEALRAASAPPPVVVYANSTQAGNGTVYGQAKEGAAEVLAKAADEVGAQFIDVKLPNLFGEHGKPFYNAVTSTFCHLLVDGQEPAVVDDKELTLLHAQNAADLLTGAVPVTSQQDLEERVMVSELLSRLKAIAKVYATGEIPDLTDAFDRDLFNTYRSYNFVENAKIPLVKKADPRGSFFEMIRTQGGESQSSFSTTVPGVSRGDHFHRRKIERFTVLVGEATISVRRLFSDEVREFHVSGDEPIAIDMPTMWPHKITNTGSGTLFTSFWVNELYDDENPDTVREAV